MGSGRSNMEILRRATRTVLFMVIMVGSLLASSAALIVAMADMIVPCALLSTFTCCTTCYTLKLDWNTYSFRSSLVDIPLLSLLRSVIIICTYYVCDVHGLSNGPYLGTTVICALASAVILSVKVCLLTISDALRSSSPSAGRSPRLKQSWGMPAMFLSSMVLALGHIVVAYRTRCQARRRLLFHGIDPEAVNFLFSFCQKLGFSSVVLVGHDDGGLLALMAAEKSHTHIGAQQVAVKGVVLIGVSTSREVVPTFARVLLHTSLGRHMLRPLLRTEIIQVANRRAWHDASKLTPDILDLYKAPLRVEGWDNALAEVSRLSVGSMFSSNNALELFKEVQGLPVLIAAGAEDILVPLRSSQVLASRFSNSRLVAISGCGHLPHEECPKALLAAIIPFVSKLFTQLNSEGSLPV